MRKELLWVLILTFVALIAIVAVLYYYGYGKACQTEECFLDALTYCQKASYTTDKEGNIWTYKIKNVLGFYKDTCIVEVKNVKVASPTAKKIEGKSMICRIPKSYAGTFLEIHQKLEFCSGPLKEALQEILIDKLYKYIIQNLGNFST